MQTMAEILTETNGASLAPSCDYEEYQRIYASCQRRKCERFNAVPGGLTGLDCPDCKNRGYYHGLTESGNMVTYRCKCMDARDAIRRIEASGLKDLLNEYTFDNFTVAEPWQARAKKMALDFVNDCDDGWFYAGGQVGAGKTQLCTAIVGEFLKRGKNARYMLWRDEVVLLKAKVKDAESYGSTISGLKNADVLYIDDLFKTRKGEPITTGDINVAFELINYRYNNRGLVTVISSEYTVRALLGIDEAIGSRIYERCLRHCLTIEADASKNFRMRQTVPKSQRGVTCT